MAISTNSKIIPCLWYDTQAEDAAKFYVSIFKNSRLGHVARFNKEGKDIHGKDAGSVMTVEFELEGLRFVALNGGPHFKFNEAISLQVHCDTQDEIDYFWSKLTAGGGSESQCGWLKDKFGLSWQVVPKALVEMLMSGNPAGAGRVTKAFLQMKKFDIAALRRAFEGKVAA
jgi:predicted 3-demethylubiquinone-9 3-methyltransferase (glyoxalase superfamily)